MGKNSTSAVRCSSRATSRHIPFDAKIEVRITCQTQQVERDILNLHVLSDQTTNLMTMPEPARWSCSVILGIHSCATQGLSETELIQTRSNKHKAWDYHNSKNMAESDRCSILGNVGNQLALTVAKRGLWAIVGLIILKVMTLCEGIAGTVDFAQLAVQSLANLLNLF